MIATGAGIPINPRCCRTLCGAFGVQSYRKVGCDRVLQSLAVTLRACGRTAEHPQHQLKMAIGPQL